MIQDIKSHNDDITINSKQIAVLKEHFPACFKTDGSFDMIRFQEEIKDQTDIIQEGYELKFLGKSYARLLASSDTTTVLQPNEVHNSSHENANSENIYISGDNLDGLKHLLKSYQSSIKCIYIDPPYNTGSDGFVYQDKFIYTAENLQEKLNVSEDEANRILDLTTSDSASHSAWLLFMYCRLLLARDILTDDGVIFISIDDNEQANLKLLCDDVFGEENFVANITVISNPRGRQSDKNIATVNDFLFIYSKNNEQVILGGKKLTKEQREEFNLIDIETKEPYRLLGLRQRGSASRRIDRPEMYFPIYVSPDGLNISLSENNDWHKVLPKKSDNSDGRWMWGLSKCISDINLLVPKLITHRNEYDVFIKDYLNKSGEERKRKYTTNWIDKGYNNQNGTQEVKSLIGADFTFYPKSKHLICDILNIGMSTSDTVLDFFSGSATTAHAVMQLNAEDGGNRKFIAVQLPELLRGDDASQKAAYEFLQENDLPTTLDYIGMERIKRAAAKIKVDQLEKRKSKAVDLFEEDTKQELDFGFKHYTLVEPNQNTLDKLETFDKAGLLADTTILDDFGKPTILATWLNTDGYGLTATAQTIDLAGYTAYYYQKHIYLIDEGFTLESMKELLSQYDSQGTFNPENVVLFGYSFPDWSISEMIDKNLRILNDSEKNLKINYVVRY